MRRGGRFIAAIIMAIIGAITDFSSRSTNEVTGEVQHISIEPDQEVALELQAFPEMAAQFGGEIDHPAISQLVTMRFGRQDELESDALGVRMMASAGYDPAGMRSLLEILGQSSEGGGRPPEFFSTHPNPENRLARVDELIRTTGRTSGDRGVDRFQQHVLRFSR